MRKGINSTCLYINEIGEEEISLKECKYIFPVYIKDYDKNYFKRGKYLEILQEISVEPRYLTKAFSSIYTDETEVCKIYALNDVRYLDIGLPNRGEEIFIQNRTFATDTDEKHSCFLNDILLASFPTGMCFFIMSICHNNHDSMPELIEKNFSFTHLISNECLETSRKKIFLYKVNGESITLIDVIKKLIGNEQKIEFPRKNLMVYQSIVKEDVEEGDRDYLYYLSRCQHESFSRTKNIEEQKEYKLFFEYEQSENICWMGCSNGVVSISYVQGNEHFIKRIHRYNVQTDYFLLYLSVVYEREMLTYYSSCAVANRYNMKILSDMQEELIEFDIQFGYNTASDEISYQMLYECLYKVFRIDFLEKDVREIVERVVEHKKAIRERNLNAFLALLSVLSLISLLNDGMSLFMMIEKATLIWIVLGIMAFGLAVCIFVFVMIGRKRIKDNKR